MKLIEFKVVYPLYINVQLIRDPFPLRTIVSHLFFFPTFHSSSDHGEIFHVFAALYNSENGVGNCVTRTIEG